MLNSELLVWLVFPEKAKIGFCFFSAFLLLWQGIHMFSLISSTHDSNDRPHSSISVSVRLHNSLMGWTWSFGRPRQRFCLVHWQPWLLHGWAWTALLVIVCWYGVEVVKAQSQSINQFNSIT
ncbi:hypothetical protein BDV95DRAFT_56120 [Massariosphaeria phaeospora]|uniref:Uncharacterized protein n=1 Tax=Massariosphaeria phaeospora TaxID=100035 RepID=A0A7C8M9A1_9PLEO|nr:hypothetical protein BDV95DRAFT_56120 [Massariosphaeria phaeospora]